MTAHLPQRLFRELSDGKFHSGEDLADRLAVSRSAVWKAAHRLRELGATVHAVRSRGYRFARPIEPLEGGRVRRGLSKLARERVRSLEVFWSVGSTNSLLLERGNPPVGACEAVLAEHQTAGRGRRGRTWLAPPGGGICLSMSWTFPEVPRDLGAMGLVVGVCALRALSAVGIADVRLKWPNDLLIEDRKLGGMLIELRAESAGPACVIIGIGINVALGAELPVIIARGGLAPTDLQGASGSALSRNAVSAELISAVVSGLLVFGREGLRPFIDEWRAADALKGRAVSVQVADRTLRGTARGIDASGSLLVETAEGLQKLISGDVSVRATS